jgi:type VI secretion system protein ImpK
VARAVLQRRGALPPSKSPIIDAAGPLLLLLGRLRANIIRSPSAPLMEEVAQAIQDFEQEVRALGFSPEQVQVAKYAISATADDIVQNIPVEDRRIWTQYSMLSRFFGEGRGGVRFFHELERAKADPVANYPLLELMHACLALGFEGMHRSSAGGAALLQQTQRSLYHTLRRVRPRAKHEFSPRLRRKPLRALPARYRVPLWAVASVTGVLLLAVYITLRTLLANRSEVVAAALLGLFPAGEVTIERPVVVSPPPPPERRVDQLERIRAALAAEIAAGTMNAEQTANEVVVTVGNFVLFEPGGAAVLESFEPVAAKIADTLEKEPGFIRILGHSDSTPVQTVRFASNHALSVERAEAVAELLRPLLSRPERLEVEGKGADQPVASNQTPEGRARNGRVEIMIPRAD